MSWKHFEISRDVISRELTVTLTVTSRVKIIVFFCVNAIHGHFVCCPLAVRLWRAVFHHVVLSNSIMSVSSWVGD